MLPPVSMKFEYSPSGTCSKKIVFAIEEGRIRSLEFESGCSGNLRALAVLLEGCPADEVAAKLRGIRCGARTTSCADQLARAIGAALEPTALEPRALETGGYRPEEDE